ncbi:MAG: acyl carrier protein [Oceanicaulis sp.]
MEEKTAHSAQVPNIPVSDAELKAWMVTYISDLLALDAAQVTTSDTFEVFGMDSVEAVVMAGVMEEEFGAPVEPSLLLEYPSIDLFVAANVKDG